MNILVIAAHPDDEVLGCGGTIARHGNQNDIVHIDILGEGMNSRFGGGQSASPQKMDDLYDQSRKAAKLLGAQEPAFHNLPDNRFDTVPLLEIIQIIEKSIHRRQPEIIYTHHGSDLNVDHGITLKAVLTATRPMQGCCVRQIYAFEVPSSTGWSFGQQLPEFRPNVFFDIDDTLERKIEAMRLYESEMRPFPHPRSPEALRALAMFRGSVSGLHAAEAFELVRLLK
jgi:LmbE family N-acetylglucosaminyl deacetylase